MQTKVSKYIRNSRKRYNLSQEELCYSLTRYSLAFENLDSITISRWESGKTKPSFQRMIKLIQFFNENPLEVFIANSGEFKKLVKAKTVSNHVGKLFQSNSSHHSIPYFTNKTQFHSRALNKFDANYEILTEMLDNFIVKENLERDYDGAFSKLLSYKNFFDIYYWSTNKQVVGHAIYSVVKQSYIDLIKKGEKKPIDISEEYITDSNIQANFSILIFSFYFGAKKPFEEFFSSIYAYLMKSTNCKYILFQVSNMFDFRLITDIFGGKPVPTSGYQSEDGAVKFMLKNYAHMSLITTREKLLNQPYLMALQFNYKRANFHDLLSAKDI